MRLVLGPDLFHWRYLSTSSLSLRVYKVGNMDRHKNIGDTTPPPIHLPGVTFQDEVTFLFRPKKWRLRLWNFVVLVVYVAFGVRQKVRNTLIDCSDDDPTTAAWALQLSDDFNTGLPEAALWLSMLNSISNSLVAEDVGPKMSWDGMRGKVILNVKANIIMVMVGLTNHLRYFRRTWNRCIAENRRDSFRAVMEKVLSPCKWKSFPVNGCKMLMVDSLVTCGSWQRVRYGEIGRWFNSPLNNEKS